MGRLIFFDESLPPVRIRSIEMNKLKQIADEKDIKISDVVRVAIMQYLMKIKEVDKYVKRNNRRVSRDYFCNY